MLVGAAIGIWAATKVQRAASRLTPGGAVEAVQRQVGHLANDVAAALAEGRRVRQATELDLRQQVRRPAIDVAVNDRQLTGLGYRERY